MGSRKREKGKTERDWEREKGDIETGSSTFMN